MIVKITVEIPDAGIDETVRLNKATSTPEAIALTIREDNRLGRRAELVDHAGTCDQLISAVNRRRRLTR